MAFRITARIFTALFLIATLAILSAGKAYAQESAEQAAVDQPLSAEELEILVARIALYPDDLVALVMAGSLYPLQIVQADRYLSDVKAKPDLKPDADWDGSVISLLNYPQIVKMMNDDLDWTEELGQAVVAQQKDILVAIQQLRDKALANGVIKSDDKVIVEKQQDNVIIKPAKKEVTYVPQYDPVILTSPTYVVESSAPAVYYGDPYPSYYYPYAPYWAGFVTGAAFGAIVDWDDWHSWGGDVDIDINDIDINNFHWDKNKINNIDWDRNRFNFDRDSIADNLRRNDRDRLDRKPGRDRSNASNLAARNKISSRDVRRDVERGLKKPGQGMAKPGDRSRAGKNLSGQTAKIDRPAQRKAANTGRPARKKTANVNRQIRKPAAKIDRRPRQMSGFGDYGRGREVKAFSHRGHVSRGGGGGRRGHGGGGRMRRR